MSERRYLAAANAVAGQMYLKHTRTIGYGTNIEDGEPLFCLGFDTSDDPSLDDNEDDTPFMRFLSLRGVISLRNAMLKLP